MGPTGSVLNAQTGTEECLQPSSEAKENVALGSWIMEIIPNIGPRVLSEDLGSIT